MKERGILFSWPMVLALLNGSKTQTRRVLKQQPDGHHWERLPGYELKKSKIVTIKDRSAVKFSHSITRNPHLETALDWLLCPHGQPGDRLWVREAWRAPTGIFDDYPPRELRPGTPIRYEADGANSSTTFSPGKMRPSMFMPRWASRITLELTDVRVERLNEISEADARAEGARECDLVSGREVLLAGASQRGSYVLHYRDIWEAINGPGSWLANPWVWVVEFKRVRD